MRAFLFVIGIYAVVARNCQCRSRDSDTTLLQPDGVRVPEEDGIPNQKDQEKTGTGLEMDTVDVKENDIKKGYKRLSILNSCSFEVNLGVTGSEWGVSKNNQCPPHQVDNKNGRCFWDLTEAPKTLLPGKKWYVDLTSEDDHVFSGNVWGVKPEGMEFACPSGECDAWVGPRGAITKAEFTISKEGTDYLDISIIEGANIPVAMYPNDGQVDKDNRYTCGVAGGCTWDFDPGSDLEKFVTNVVGHEGTCESQTDCGKGVCGMTLETSPPTYGVCGTFNGYVSAHLSCMAGSTGAPFFCEENNDVISCMGDYGLSGYNQPEGTTVCGCPDWEAMGIDAPPIAKCQTSDKNWEEKSLPFLIFLKEGCPMAYEFAYSDMTSTITCGSASSYTIEFCPDETESVFFK